MFSPTSTPDDNAQDDSAALVPEPVGVDLDALAQAAESSELDTDFGVSVPPAGGDAGAAAGATTEAERARPSEPAAPPSFYGLLPVEVEGVLLDAGWERFRARQVLEWVYGKRTRDPGSMTNLAKVHRERLTNLVDLSLPRIH